MDIFLLLIVFIIGLAIALATTVVVFRLNKNSEVNGLSERLLQLTESHAISQTQITQQFQTQERALAKFLEEKLVMTAARVNETLEKNTNSQKSSLEDLKENSVFYDYTKILGKIRKYKNSSNYHLTFSRAEDNNSVSIAALNDGANVSIVFRNGLPRYWRGYKVIDGDTSDILMIYNRNVVLGLKAKGDAKKDKTGFVVDAVNPI